MIHFLTNLLLSLTLIVSGATAAAAQVRMAAQRGATTEVIICGGAGVTSITLNAAGDPVAPKAPHDCATCPECLQAPVATLPTPAVMAPQLTMFSACLLSLPVHFVLTRALWHVQARAPPRGL